MVTEKAPYAAQPLDADPRARIKRALDTLAARRMAYARPGDYYAGAQVLTFATQSFRNVFGGLFREFADNLCRSTVDAVVDRLEIAGFENELATETGDAARIEGAWRIWQDNRMDLGSIEVHLDAVLYGDGYVIVWPGEDGRPEIHPNDPRWVTVAYDAERRDRIAWAAKCWRQDDDRYRLTLYYPDRIEKYVTSKPYRDDDPDDGGAFEPYTEAREPWPLPNPYDRVPVFHFANGAKRGQFGVTELADVMPLQDALNKQYADMIVAGEFVAFPQRYAIGVASEIDQATGKPRVPFKPGPGNLWTVEEGKDTVQFGSFETGDMQQYLAALDNTRVEIARVSRTPLHYLVPMAGTPPSGESLKTAEGPFLGKVKRKQVMFGNVWEDALRFALEIAGEPVADLRLSALWKDAETRSEKDDLEGLDIKRNKLAVSRDQVWREAGYSEKQIKAMAAEAEKAAAEMAASAATAQNGNGRFGGSS